jgi:hypothetical protein
LERGAESGVALDVDIGVVIKKEPGDIGVASVSGNLKCASKDSFVSVNIGSMSEE